MIRFQVEYITSGKCRCSTTLRYPLPRSHSLPPLQQRRQILPPLPPPTHPILPIPNLRPHHRLVPLIQTLKRRHPTQFQNPHPIIRQRPLQFHLPFHPLRAREHAQDLPVDLEAVEQVREVLEVRGRRVLPVDVEPDETRGVDRAAVYLGDVDGVDVGEARVDGGEDGVVVGGVEGGAGGVGGGDVDGGGVDEGGGTVVEGVGEAGHGWVVGHSCWDGVG